MTYRAERRAGDTLSALYGAAAALARRDRSDAELLVAHLLDTEDVHDVLLAASFATLERLETALLDSSRGERGEGRGTTADIAGEMLAKATTAGLGSRQAVHAAAWRLDAVRMGDAVAAAEAITTSRERLPDGDLVAGAVSVLAVMVTLAAAEQGDPVPRSAQHLCLAALLAAG